MIRYSTPHIIGAAAKESAKQYKLLAALNRLYRCTQDTLPPAVRQQNQDYNRSLDSLFEERGLPMARLRTALTNVGVGEFGQYERDQLLGMFEASRNLLTEINCPLPELLVPEVVE